MYKPEFSEREQTRLCDGLIEAIQVIQANPEDTRKELVKKLVLRNTQILPKDQDPYIIMAIKLIFMVSCGHAGRVFELLESATLSRSWTEGVGLTQFVNGEFPMTDYPNLNDPESSTAFSIKSNLKARNLKKQLGFTFHPTDDIRNHLRLDFKTGVVQIFHYTSFLKEHLRASKDLPPDLPAADYLNKGLLPRQFALEILDSIQKILFPLNETKSQSLLEFLTSPNAGGFDPDCLRFESVDIRHKEEKDIAYYYFGSRLMELHQELENPRPRGLLEKWVERRSGARYVMLATLAGVIIAVFLGIAGLAVTSYQTWIAYQQWQHPVTLRRS
jgi:hypothetical protein